MPVITRHIAVVLFLLLASPVFADELGDAKNAYGAGEFEEAAALLRPLARDGNPEALYLLGRMYEQGDGVGKDEQEARDLYRQAAEKGHNNAGQRLALFENSNSGDESVVLEWYLPSAEEGDMEAQYNLGFMYETGWGIGIDERKAVRWYKEAADQQHDMAQLRLGMMYVVGKGVEKDQDAGVELLRLSAENGNRIAEILVQEVFDIGDAKKLNAEKLISGLRRVVDEGEKEALRTLNASLDRARSRNRKQEREAEPAKEDTRRDTRVLNERQPVESDERLSSAQLNIARALDKGTGVPENEAEMVRWYISAARQGNADAQFNLGVLYMQGRGVNRDTQEGLRWFNAAASQGHQLSKDYLQLWNNDPDNSSLGGSIAVTWLKENARNWDLESLFLLGQIYEMGRGVNQNLNEAKLWYRLAAEGGHREAKRRLDQIGQGVASPTTATTVITTPADRGVGQDSTLTTGKAVASQFDWFWMILGVAGIVGLGSVVFFLFRRSGGQMPSFQLQRPAQNTIGANQLRSEDVDFLKGLWDDKPEPERPVAEVKAKPAEPAKVAPEPATNRGGATEVFKAVTWGPGGKKKPIIPEDDIQLPDIRALVSDEVVRDEDTAVEKPVSDAPPPKAVSEPTRVKHVAPPVQTPPPRPPSQPTKSSEQGAPVKATETNISVERVRGAGEMRVEPPRVKPAESPITGKQTISAEGIAGTAISRDALASGRVKADNLFDDGFGIDREGKVLPKRSESQISEKPTEEARPSGPIDFADLDLHAIRRGGESVRAPVINIKSEGPVSAERSSIPSIEKPSIARGTSRVSANNLGTSTTPPPPPPPLEPSTQQSAQVTDISSGGDESRSLAEVHFNIGLMFATGDGVPKNDVMAAKWFRKSADEGLPEAQFRLGEFYLSGTGLEKDIDQGMQWIRKAAKLGHTAAIELLTKRNQA
ncbi:MAG: sel1 repeat family protein [Gammaproteobacteria bacterium]|nr:sel1 repeat family protein [Gammaproteobacteria bacterium]